MRGEGREQTVHFRKNWFTALAAYVYMAAVVLTIVFGMAWLRERQNFGFLPQTLLCIGFFVALILVNMAFWIVTRPPLVRAAYYVRRAGVWIEAALVVYILVAGFILRINYIHTYPVAMESDYRFYYDVADMMMRGTLLTEANNEYLALFPNCVGYSWLIALVMRIFGQSPLVPLYFNAVLSTLTALFCYGIGRKLEGGLCGLTALALAAFWPSQIAFSNTNGTEAPFTFLLYGTALLVVHIMKEYGGKDTRSAALILLHFAAGALLAMASAIRPMSVIFLVALVLCLIFINQKLKFKDINSLPLGRIFLSKGWLRAAAVLAAYALCTMMINAAISKTIQKDAASSGAFGYSLMVGVDIESDGHYSARATRILFDTYEATKSAAAAHQACLNKAMADIKANPMGTLELLAKKFYLLWSNDDYGMPTTYVSEENQRLLTPEYIKLMNKMIVKNNIYYLFVVSFSGVGVLYLLKKRESNAHLFSVFFAGAVVVHLIIEVQNRYHYYLLQNFAILAAVGVALIFKEYLGSPRESAPAEAYSEPPAENPPEHEPPQSHVASLDVLEAIREGHIVITATEAYKKEAGGEK